MDNTQRMANLMEGTRFRDTPDWSSEHPLMDWGEHNCREWEKLGEERQERGLNLIGAILADFFQPLALKQYGHTSDSAMRGVLYNKMFPPDDDEELNNWGQHVQKEAISIGLNKKQADKLQQWYMSCFPTWLVAYLAELMNRWQLVPRVTAQRTTDILTTMFSEVANVDSQRHN